MMFLKKKVRNAPISLKQLADDDEKARLRELSIENPCFELSSLRKPIHALDSHTKK